MATLASVPRSDIGYLSDAYGQSVSFIDALEQVPDLTWPLSVQTYARMRTDPQITAVINAYSLPIRAATWSVDPAGCRDEVVELVADDLGLPILGVDPEPGSARRRGVRWPEHLRLACLHLVFGHMPFEQRYDIIDGRARLAALSERMPQTIRDIALNTDGSLRGIQQNAADATIPAQRLLWYVHEREGAAWQGRSMLRPAFAPWLLKHEVWRVHATSIRRFGMGVPNVEAPQGATPAQVAEAARLAGALRVGDQSGVGMPSGFKLNLTGLTGGTPDALEFVRYLDAQIAQMALVSVLNLDASPNGSRALGETFIDLLLTSLGAVADEMGNTATGLAVQIVDYNWGDAEPAPRVVSSDVGARPEVTAEAIAALMGAGAINADPELEAWVRQRSGIPERDRGAPLPGAAPPPAPPETEAEVAEPVAAAAAPAALRRQLTDVEARSGADFTGIQVDWQTATARLVRDWDDITRAQRAELANAVAAAVDDGQLRRLAELSVDSRDAAELLADRMRAVAEQSAGRMAAEAQGQGVPVDPGTVDDDRIGMVAAAVAGLLAAGLAQAAGRRAIQTATPESTGRQVADAVDAHLASLSDTFLTDNLGGALTNAQNQGRLATLAAAPAPAALAASEVLDANTCSACADIDGHQYASLAEAQDAYANGGYTGCEGFLRCRGILVAVWDGDR